MEKRQDPALPDDMQGTEIATLRAELAAMHVHDIEAQAELRALKLQVRDLQNEKQLLTSHANEGWDLANARTVQLKDAERLIASLRNVAHNAVDYVGMANYAERQKEAHDLIDRTFDMKADLKRICEHEWSHIEDYHFFCAKCKATADLCGKCSTEKTATRAGGLVCLKCNPQ